MISPSARRKLIIVAVLAIGGLVLISQRRLLLPPLADWLDVGISPTRADYIMVLPGHSETRPFVAASWVRLGLADQVLLPRTRSSGDIEDGIIPPTHEIEAAVMECCGLHKEQVVILPGESASTFDDAQALAAFIAGQPEARVAIVTSGFHTRRARWVFRQRIPELMDRIQFVSAPNPGFHAKRWWRTPRGLDTVCSEYLKLLFYW
ncbi:MAG: ElyC/SanA/YdcF family protein, partial [Pirellulaceae bacterium]|nr:ElyC/SanA/YdcF family protein [Pirellulaceae bacterium]